MGEGCYRSAGLAARLVVGRTRHQSPQSRRPMAPDSGHSPSVLSSSANLNDRQILSMPRMPNLLLQTEATHAK